MKSFIVSLFVFAVVICLIIANNIYINSTVEELQHMTDSLESLDVDGCEKIEKFWEEHHNTISLSVSFTEIRTVHDNIAALKAYAETGDEKEFERTRQSLLISLHALGRLEKISVFNIF